jgi:hypothetical protein
MKGAYQSGAPAEKLSHLSEFLEQILLINSIQKCTKAGGRQLPRFASGAGSLKILQFAAVS